MAFKVSIQRVQLESIAKKSGCDVDVKASYVKITKGATSKNCMFVAKTKDVSRIDIGGFDYIGVHALVRNLGGESHGCVHQQLRSDVTREQMLAGFEVLCLGLDSFESHPKRVRPSPHTFKFSKRKNIETIIVKVDETPAQTVTRLVAKLNTIRDQSTKMGIPVSPKTERELGDQINAATILSEAELGAAIPLSGEILA